MFPTAFCLREGLNISFIGAIIEFTTPLTPPIGNVCCVVHLLLAIALNPSTPKLFLSGANLSPAFTFEIGRLPSCCLFESSKFLSVYDASTCGLFLGPK